MDAKLNLNEILCKWLLIKIHVWVEEIIAEVKIILNNIMECIIMVCIQIGNMALIKIFQGL